MAQSNIAAFGFNEVITKTTSYTILPADSGTIVNVTGTATITLPATVVGIAPIIRVGADGITVTVAPNASDNIYGAQITAADNKAVIFTNSPVGSYIQLIADGTAAGGWGIVRLDLGGASSTFARAA